jgi:tryptophan synthase alpha chain
VKIIENNVEQPEAMLKALAEFVTPMKAATQK